MRVFCNSDVSVSVQEGIHEIPKPVGRTLLIIVDEDDIIAVSKVTAADQRIVPPAVFGQVNSDDMWIVLRLFFDDIKQVVG